MVDMATLQSGDSQKGLGEITIPLTVSTILAIENHRNGGDLVLKIDSRVLLCPVHQGPTGPSSSVLSAPMETRFSVDGGVGDIKCTIPQSEWVKLLPQLGWSDIELLELPIDFLRGHLKLARARERLNDAQISLARGDWEGVLQDCRKAVEAVAFALTDEEDSQAAMSRMKEHFGKGPKGENLTAIALAFSKFLHLARHEQSEPITLERADAILALRITVSLMDYLARR
jgi:hypothetical protein